MDGIRDEQQDRVVISEKDEPRRVPSLYIATRLAYLLLDTNGAMQSIQDMNTDIYAGFELFFFWSGDSASQDWSEKTKDTLPLN